VRHHARVKIYAVALVVLLLAGCGSTQKPDVLHPAAEPAPVNPSGVPSRASASPQAQCLAPGVEIFISAGDAAAGLRFESLTLRNCGTHSYIVDGYPSATLLDAGQRPLKVKVAEGVDHVYLMPDLDKPPKHFVLAPGGTATAEVVWRNLTTDEETIVNGEYLRVAGAPGQPTHLLTLHVDLGNTGILALSPWLVPHAD
jgi:hypothetical protein